MTDFVIQRLKNMGFYKLEEGLPALYALGASLARSAGDESKAPNFELLPSFLTAGHSSQIPQTNVLAIDIGGTSAKAGIRLIQEDGSVRWRYLFEEKNIVLKKDTESNNSFVNFASALAERVRLDLDNKEISCDNIQAVGIVWSNAIENFYSPELGIAGSVAAREQYSKGEWFIKDLKNGDDLAGPLLKAFRASGINIKNLIITNDTPFTLAACLGASAGVVASTGVNATLLKNGTRNGVQGKIICNAEMGGRFPLDESFLSEGDMVADGGKANTIERLIGGAFIPAVFCGHLILLSDLSCLKQAINELEKLGDKKWSFFNTRDLSSLISDKKYFFERHPEYQEFPDECIHALEVLSTQILARAAKLLTAIVYASIANQIAEGETSFTISLDSRLAREVPLFWESFSKQLKKCIPDSIEVEVVLAVPIETPTGSISVPMQGAANAIDSLQAVSH